MSISGATFNQGLIMLARMLALVMIAISLIGCTPKTVIVDLEATAQPEAMNRTRFVILENPVVPFKSKEAWECHAQMATKALVEKGWTHASSLENANVVIILDYSVADPHYITIDRYCSGTKEESLAQGQIALAKFKADPKNYNPPYVCTPPIPVQLDIAVVLYYKHTLNLFAVDPAELGKEGSKKYFWELHAQTNVNCKDSQRVFPIILAACKNKMGFHTRGIIEIEIEDNDPVL